MHNAILCETLGHKAWAQMHSKDLEFRESILITKVRSVCVGSQKKADKSKKAEAKD